MPGRHLLQSVRVSGLGLGTFFLIFFGVLLGTICLLTSRTKYARSAYIASAATYGLVLLILLATPRGPRLVDTATDVNDWSQLWLLFMSVAMLSGVVLAGYAMLREVVSRPVRARKLNEYQDILGIH